MAQVVSPPELEISHGDAGLRQSLTQESAGYNSIQPAMNNQPEQTEKKLPCYRQKGSLFEHAVYFACLSTASYVGVLVRLYLTELAHWDGVALFPSLYPQMVGTMIMGVISSHKLLLASKHMFLYQAIATGLCGSITTFSSWNSEAVSSLLQTGQDPPDNAVRGLGWGTTIFLGLGMPSAALTLGRHVAVLSPWSDSRVQGKLSSPRAPSQCSPLTVEGSIFVGLWLLATPLVTVVPFMLERYDLVFICLFALFGTYIRWHLAPLNSVFLNFKLGTFLANVGGSWLLGGVLCVQQLYSEVAMLNRVLVGVGVGFCGCLTTVSTFAVELSTLSLKHSYFYAFTSIALAQLGLVLVRGTVQYTT